MKASVCDFNTTPRKALVRFTDIRNKSRRMFGVNEDSARDLIAQLTAWLDAPRLAARETATVAMAHGGVELMQTAANEWGVRYDPGAQVEWTDEPTARAEFVRESRIGKKNSK